ncbi:MAG: DNA-processing protein DprA [Deltaproteobacteria bacterium]|nr:DNA-processing protein DprA [Deltaproteobacteria bacterium]
MLKNLLQDDPDYPSLLKEIPKSPTLFYEGDLSSLKGPCHAIFGSRAASNYGREVAFQLARELAERGFVVVSGFAEGIDAMAHQGALAGGGKTIAVLGAGLDVVYPREHYKTLKPAIRENGLLVTEQSPGTPPLPQHFPSRNRIISGLSYGVIVVEAALKSGSLITAQWALEQNREVFAVPGPIESRLSEGPHRLIQNGAKLVHTVDDILSELPMLPKSEVVAKKTEDHYNALDVEEKKIFSLLSMKPISVDEIVRQLKMDSGSVLSLLLSLELRGCVTQHPGKQFSRRSSRQEALS